MNNENIMKMRKICSKLTLTLFRMGLSGAAHAKKALLKIYNDETWHSSYLKKIKKCINYVTHPLDSNSCNFFLSL